MPPHLLRCEPSEACFRRLLGLFLFGGEDAHLPRMPKVLWDTLYLMSHVEWQDESKTTRKGPAYLDPEHDLLVKHNVGKRWVVRDVSLFIEQQAEVYAGGEVDFFSFESAIEALGIFALAHLLETVLAEE